MCIRDRQRGDRSQPPGDHGVKGEHIFRRPRAKGGQAKSGVRLPILQAKGGKNRPQRLALAQQQESGQGEMCIRDSIYTVRTHIANIYKKFEVNNKVDLLMHLQPILKDQTTPP